MLEGIFLGTVAVLTLVAVGNWRVGLFAAILIDVLRDPVRKLSDSHSVLITVGGTLIWGGVLLGAFNAHGAEITSMFRRFRHLGTALQCLLLALVPGVLLSLVLYVGGYKLVLIGLISYLGPLIGIAVGFLVPVRERDMYRVFQFYSLVNAVALVGTVLEASGMEHPVLGGIDMDWIRQHSGLNVELIAGIYRSPDIMGLHAAHVTVFSMMLAERARGPKRLGWIGLAVWGLQSVLLSGRRKMVGIPLVFIASYLALGMWRGSRRAGRLASLVAMAAFAGATALVVFQTDGDRVASNEYTQYAGTLFTEGGGRAQELVVGSIIATLYQSGILGSGIGSVTQGSHYVAVDRNKAWQEDGVSRLFKELGVPGVLLILTFMWLLWRTVLDALKLIPAQHPLALQQVGVLSIVVANAASFTISHQQYSGDPGSAILAVMMLGMVLGMPRVYFRERDRQKQREAELAVKREPEIVEPAPRIVPFPV
jgi:hypothetical protein